MADMVAFKQHVLEFQKLQINTIRIYTVDNSPDMNHDEGMNLLSDAGIYVALDVNNPSYSLNRKDDKALGASYNEVRQFPSVLFIN
jgi:1,3-beta-glucanosyltransferase GAS5